MDRMFRVLVALGGFAILVPGIAFAQTSGTLFVRDGKVGIGTSTPVAPLHIVETSATPTLKNMFRLTNNGGIQFLLERTDGNDWQFSNFGASFQISIPGSSTPQFQAIASGDVVAGRDLIATRNVIGQNISASSSRTLKDNFVAIDPKAVLDRVALMPISEWSFKGEDIRHIGPVAEDFQAAFGFGQVGKGLSLTDTNGVALAAIKGLQAEIQELKKTVEEQSRLLQRQQRLLQTMQAQAPGKEAPGTSRPF